MCLFFAGLEHKRCQIADKLCASVWASGLFSDSARRRSGFFMSSTEVYEKGCSVKWILLLEESLRI